MQSSSAELVQEHSEPTRLSAAALADQRAAANAVASGAQPSAERASDNSSDQSERHQPAQRANQQVGLVVHFRGGVVGGGMVLHEMRAP
jgi:hypothetical protein